MIETMEVNTIEVQGIYGEEDEVLKNVVAVWGILLKGMTELNKGIIRDNVANITRSGKHYKPSILEKDYLGRDIGEGSKPTEPKEKEEEDRVLTQAYVMVWGLLKASYKHCNALLDALSGKEV